MDSLFSVDRVMISGLIYVYSHRNTHKKQKTHAVSIAVDLFDEKQNSVVSRDINNNTCLKYSGQQTLFRTYAWLFLQNDSVDNKCFIFWRI